MSAGEILQKRAAAAKECARGCECELDGQRIFAMKASDGKAFSVAVWVSCQRLNFDLGSDVSHTLQEAEQDGIIPRVVASEITADGDRKA